MTTLAPEARAGGGSLEPGRGNLLLSEWTKIRSVRSTVWTLISFVVVAIGLTTLITWLTVNNLSTGKHGSAATGVATDPVNFILGSGMGLAQLAICVLGVLVITSEYSSGTIRASSLAVPRRLPMLAAKCLVFAALVFVIGEAIAFSVFYLGAFIVHSHVVTGNSALAAVLQHDGTLQNGRITVSLGQHDVLRAVIGSGLYLTVLGLFALAIGGLIRHTAGAIAAVIALVLVLLPLTQLLPSSWGAHVNAYMPTVAGLLITDDKVQSGQLLPAWGGFAVFCGWTAALLIGAGWLLRARDV